jgi:hypothetical protein
MHFIMGNYYNYWQFIWETLHKLFTLIKIVRAVFEKIVISYFGEAHEGPLPLELQYSDSQGTNPGCMNSEISNIPNIRGKLATIQFRNLCIPVNYQNVKIKIYRTISVPVVLYECVSWSFTLTMELASGQPDVHADRPQFKSRHNNNWLKKWGEWRLTRTRQSTDFNFTW